jgi:hypothetical protein
MATTYEPIATTTLGSAAASYTFSSISSAYTDLVLVAVGTVSNNGDSLIVRFNSDTTTNYSNTFVRGDGTSATSSRSTSQTSLYLGNGAGFSSTQITNAIMNIQNYANTTTYKTTISRVNNPAGSVGPGTEAIVGLWRKTPEAINTILVGSQSGTMSIGMTLTLYGIKAA